MRRPIIFLLSVTFVVGATVVAGALISTKGPSARDNQDLAALKLEVERLRGRVGSAEAVSTAALVRAGQTAEPAPNAARPTGEPSAPSEQTPPTRPAVPDEHRQLANFQQYFTQIDALRGTAEDPTLAGKFRALLSAHDWKDGGGSSEPENVSVACGNGYCRLSMTFKDLKDAQAARSKLPYAMISAATNLSLYLDPATLQLEAYVATEGKPFPQFPQTNG